MQGRDFRAQDLKKENTINTLKDSFFPKNK